MAGSFSARLAELRKSKRISQKEAASHLGISQALLSHYEKGIRECSLDFVCKAAKYYDVTSDYLLGLSESKKSIGAEFEEIDLSSDSELSLSTIYRAASMIQGLMPAKNTEENLESFLTVGLYRLICAKVGTGDLPSSWLGFSPETSGPIADVASFDILRRIRSQSSQKQRANLKEPLCVKTVIESAEMRFSKVLSEIEIKK